MIHRYLLPVALLAAACGAEPKPPAAAPPAEAPPAPAPAPAAPSVVPDMLLRGIVQLDPAITFQSCDTRIIASPVDSTGGRLVSTFRLMHATGETGMYVLARGVRAGNGLVILREIQFARIPTATEGCDQPLPNADIVVRGTKPDWGLTLSSSGSEFTQATDPVSIIAPAVQPTMQDGIMKYDISAGTGGAHTLQLELTPAACNLGGDYIYSSMRAVLSLDGKPLAGCAWRTRLR